MSKKQPMTAERQRVIQARADKESKSSTNTSGFKKRAQRTVDKNQ